MADVPSTAFRAGIDLEVGLAALFAAVTNRLIGFA
jgi:hypothetical protein